MKKKLDKNYFFYNFAKVLLGGTVLGLAYSKLMVPNDIINGGVTSLAMILSKITLIRVSFFTQTITILFLVLSLIFLGSKNFLLSIVSSLTYTQTFSLFSHMNFSINTNIFIDFFLASLLIAFGYYLCISAGASTVGLEVIALIIKKRRNDINLANAIRFLNYTVLLFGLFIYGINSVIIGLLFSYVYSYFLKFFLWRFDGK